MTAAVPVRVALTPRRVQLLEAIAARLGEQLGRPLSPGAALGVLVDRGRAALAALEREQFREGRSTAGPADPDAAPQEASFPARRLYREAVRQAIGARLARSSHSPNPLAWPWECGRCSRKHSTAEVLAGRRWWECPSCPPSPALRRRVRALRRSWDWVAVERDAARQVEEKRARAVEVEARAGLREARFAIPDGRALEAKVCRVAGLERDDEARMEQHGFRCRRCRSTWRPFAPVPLAAAVALAPSDLRAPLAWWACPKGCNARQAVKVAALAGNRLARAWLGPVDAATAARLRGGLA